MSQSRSKRPRGENDSSHHLRDEGALDEETSSPVRIVPSPPSTSENRQSISLASRTLLKDILYPMTPEDFMKHYFRCKAVHIQCSHHHQQKGKKDQGKNGSKRAKKSPKKSEELQAENENRYQPIIEEGMYNLNVHQLIKETSSDSVFVWLPTKPYEGSNNKDASASKVNEKKEDNTKNNPLIQSVEIPDTETAWTLHQSGGHSLYCRAPPNVEQVLVAKMLRDIGLGCGQYDPSGESMTSLARGEVEMFITAKAGGTTDWHYDFQENFTLQLSGVKRWTVQQGVVSHPLRACTPHYKAPDVVESQLKAAHLSCPEFVFGQPKITAHSQGENGFNAKGKPEAVTLYPGDAFYFPAGMWHKIEVLEPGVSINISLMAANYAHITCQALQHYLLKRDEWRQVITHNPTSNPRLDPLEHLKRLLKDLPGIVEEFEKEQGGAQAILPPVLRQPPTFHVADDSPNDDDRSSNSTGDLEEKPSANRQKDNEDDGGDEWEEVDIDEDGGEGMELSDSAQEHIVDSWDFHYPPAYTGPCEIDREQTTDLLASHKLILNPLASLIRMDEVTSYYAKQNIKACSDEDKNLFILNVNYAGVESHESAVRVVLRDDPKRQSLNHLCQSVKNEERQELREAGHRNTLFRFEELVLQACNDCIPLLHCLMYYGYCILVPRGKT